MGFITIRFISEQQENENSAGLNKIEIYLSVKFAFLSHQSQEGRSVFCLFWSYIPFPGSQKVQDGCCSSSHCKSLPAGRCEKGEESTACCISSRTLLQDFHSVFMAYQSVAEPEIEARFPGSYSKLFPTVCLLPLAFSSDFFFWRKTLKFLCFSHSLVFVSRRWFFSWMPGKVVISVQPVGTFICWFVP